MTQNLCIPFSITLALGFLGLISCQSIEKLNDPNFKNRSYQYSDYKAPNKTISKPEKTKVLAAISLEGFNSDSWIKDLNSYLNKQGFDLSMDTSLSRSFRKKVTKSKNHVKPADAYFSKIASILKSSFLGRDEDQAIETTKALVENYARRLKQSFAPSDAFIEAMFWGAVNTMDKDTALFEVTSKFYSTTVPTHLVRELEVQVSPSVLARIYSSSSKTAKLKIAGTRSGCEIIVNGQKTSNRNVIIPSGVESVLTSICSGKLSYATSFKVNNYITVRNNPTPAVKVSLPSWKSLDKRSSLTEDKKLAFFLFREKSTGYLYFQAMDTKNGKKLTSSQMVANGNKDKKATHAWIGRQIKLAQSKT